MKERTERNYKKYLSIVLILLLIGITSLTFALWHKYSHDEGGDINIGDRNSITVVSEVPMTAGKLIPVGAELKDGDVYALEAEYKVTVEKFVEEYEFVVTAVILNDSTGILEIVVDEFDQFAEGVLETLVKLTIRFKNPDNDTDDYDSLVAIENLKYKVTFEYTHKG